VSAARRKAKLARHDELERLAPYVGQPLGATIADCLRAKWPQARDEEATMVGFKKASQYGNQQMGKDVRDDGTVIFYSYNTAIGFKRPGEVAVFTKKSYGVTTSKHRNIFHREVGGGFIGHEEFMQRVAEAGLSDGIKWDR